MTRRIFCKVLLAVVVVFGLLVLSNVLLAQGNSENAFERVREVQERHTERLMAKEGVEGTAIGLNQNERLAIKVFTARPGVGGIAKELDGVPVQVVVTGKIYALPKDDNPGQGKGGGKGGGKKEKIDPTARFDRPVPIGVSTGNEGECSSGTIGCRVTDGIDVYALSNNHVYALENTAPIGSKVLQPGLYDTSDCVVYDANVIGTLDDFELIEFVGNPAADWDTWPVNYIDAAIALSSTAELGNATPSDGYGTPKSATVAASLRQVVKKYGRTTGPTKGQIWALNAEIKVIYGKGIARFDGQIGIVPTKGDFSAKGDSGSLVLTQKGNPVGLLFAGGGGWTFANPIEPVLTRFGVTVDGQ